jgi:bifunctional non-homologous end joining protein LigD
MRAPGDLARMSVPAPMLATPGPVPTGPQFFIEPKWDGARLICTHGEGGRTDLFSRHTNNLSASFPDVRAACTETLAGRRVVLDGEVVVLDRLARPNFQLLQRRLHVTRPVKSLLTGCAATLFVFDILVLDGQDVTALPYLQRRALLDDLGLEAAGPRLVKSPAWLDLDGAAALEIMDSLQLEGVVAKAVNSPYQPGRRSRHWIKTPIRRRGSFVIGGFAASASGRHAVSSLLVGGFDAAGDLIYCGRITSGLSERARRTLYTELAAIRQPHSPFRMNPELAHNGVQWVAPLIVARIEYREFTNRLRHAAFKGVEQASPLAAALPAQL